MDLQQRSWLPRSAASDGRDGSVLVGVCVNEASCRGRSNPGSNERHVQRIERNGNTCRFPVLKPRADPKTRPNLCTLLAALGLAARHLFHLAFLRPASVITGLERIFRLALLARSSLHFLAFFPTQSRRICHKVRIAHSCSLAIGKCGDSAIRESDEPAGESEIVNYSTPHLIFMPSPAEHTFPPASSARILGIVP